MNIYIGVTNFAGLFEPAAPRTLLRWQAETALWVIVFSGVVTFVLLKLVGLVIPLRASDEELEIGDHAIHGHEVYPADVASLGSFGRTPHFSRRRRPEDVSGRGPQQRALRVRGHRRTASFPRPTLAPKLPPRGGRTARGVSLPATYPPTGRTSPLTIFPGRLCEGRPGGRCAAIVGRRDGGWRVQALA